MTSAGEVVVSVATQIQHGRALGPPPLWQQRTYGWTGQGFAQTAGPTTFAADPVVASFTVTAPPVALTEGSDGFREGTLTATVRADGPGGVEVGLMVVTSAERGPGGDWARCGADSSVQWALCDLGVLAVGASRTFSLPIRVPADLYLGDGTIGMMVVRIDQFEYEPVTIHVANP